jgi:hypothetical protein
MPRLTASNPTRPFKLIVSMGTFLYAVAATRDSLGSHVGVTVIH